MISTLTKVDERVIREIEEEKKIRKTNDVFLLFSLGSQFDHLIKQMVEKLGFFCLVADPSRVTSGDVAMVMPKGIILSGGPASMHEDPPKFDNTIFDLQIPVLGICLGFQYWAKYIGCNVVSSEKREFSTHDMLVSAPSQLFAGLKGSRMKVLQSHGDKVLEPGGGGFKVLGCTENAIAAARYRHLWGVQFHPEVPETVHGQKIFENFCVEICKAEDSHFAEDTGRRKIAELREKIGDKKVLLALSGGSDSSTVAYLLKHALEGKTGQLRGVYIKGVDRPDDEAHMLKYFGNQDWIEVKVVDATERFLQILAGKTDMAEKRRAFRGVYKPILEAEAQKFVGEDPDWRTKVVISQGTLYTDICESGGGYDTGARKDQIKLHHNVKLNFCVPELTPLDDQVKDTGRNIGRSVGVPEVLLTRQPFPGPGTSVRIEGEVTADGLRIARQIDDIWIGELRKHKLYHTVWQAGAVVTQSKVTCTKGDGAASGIVVRLWAVWSVNGFTARAAELPYDFLKRVARRITNEVREVGSVDYRISDKPPATIECG